MKDKCYNQLSSGVMLAGSLMEIDQMIWGLDHYYRSTEQLIPPENMLFSAITEIKAAKVYAEDYKGVMEKLEQAEKMLEDLQKSENIVLLKQIGSGKDIKEKKEMFTFLRTAQDQVNSARHSVTEQLGEDLIECECGK